MKKQLTVDIVSRRGHDLFEVFARRDMKTRQPGFQGFAKPDGQGGLLADINGMGFAAGCDGLHG